jgi:5-methylcytosine-specific restriction endonuclease McrA
MEIISRQDAIKQGLQIYFTGVPCKRGHISRHHIKKGCYECKNIISKAGYERNKGKIKVKKRVYCAANAEKEKLRAAGYHQRNKEKISKRQKAWREANKELAKSGPARWREANPERAKTLVNAWHAANKDRRRIHKLNRRGKLSSGKLSKDIVKKLLVIQRGLCACCNLPLEENYHLDHIMPLALCGQNVDSNMQLLKQRCNHQKGAKHPIDFMQQRGFLI